MSELKAMCLAEGFEKVQTYIASGNVVFSADRSESEVKTALEKRLIAHAGKPVGVIVRTAQRWRTFSTPIHFPTPPRNLTVAIFLDAPPTTDTLDGIKGRKDEEVRLGTREIYVAYGPSMGRSKLTIPAEAAGTARNINTIANLAELAAST